MIKTLLFTTFAIFSLAMIIFYQIPQIAKGNYKMWYALAFQLVGLMLCCFVLGGIVLTP